MFSLFGRWDYRTVSFAESQPILQCLYTGLCWDERHRFWWFLSTPRQFRPPTPSIFRATNPQNQETRLEISKGSIFSGLYCILRCICDACGKVIMLWVVPTVSTPVNPHATEKSGLCLVGSLILPALDLILQKVKTLFSGSEIWISKFLTKIEKLLGAVSLGILGRFQ